MNNVQYDNDDENLMERNVFYLFDINTQIVIKRFPWIKIEWLQSSMRVTMTIEMI
jgi:hypothetical protein